MMKNTVKLLLLFLILPVLLFAQEKKYIAYSSDNTSGGYFQIFIMDEDGNNKRQLTDLATNCIYPKWSNDGQNITFYTEDDNSSPGVYVISKIFESEVPEVEYITEGTHPVFSSNDDAIIFNSDMDGLLTIYVKVFDEEDIYLLGVTDYANQQTMSKDGRWLAFSMLTDDGKGVMMFDLQDTTDDALYTVSKNKNANMLPDISPDAGQIVYSSFDQNLNGTIYIYEEGVETNISKSIKSADQPKFSPDGKKIGFVAIEGDNVKLYYMNPDGSGKKKLDIKGDAGSYNWLDENTIVYDADDGGKYIIGKININTEENTILTDDGNNIKPAVQFITEKE